MAKTQPDRPITLEEDKRVVREFLNRLLIGQEGKLKKMRRVPRAKRPLYIEQDIEYTRHSVSTLKWAIAISDSRAR